MVNSQNISENKEQDKVPWIIRHQNITSLIVSLLAFLISAYLTEILKLQPPYYEFNIVKLIVSFSVAGIVGIFTKMANVYISRVVKNIYDLKTNFIKVINNEMNKIYEATANAFYKGFFSLLSGGKIQEGLKGLEKSLGQAITSDYTGRSVIFNFMIDSISKIGESGFVMVHASVGDYVNYINQALKDAEINVTSTCVVRPYWFMTDEIQISTTSRGHETIVLAPCYSDYNRFGKAEHLPIFSANGKEGVKYQRILVIDENMLAEVLLTGYIDKIIASDKIGKFLSFRSQSLQDSSNQQLNDIWEIEWFKKEVNKNQSVDLKYTFLRNDFKTTGVAKELDDRIYVYKNSRLKLEIKFQFTNLEKGNFYMTWGDQTVPLEFISGNEYRWEGRTHRIYDDFADLLNVNRQGLKEKMLIFVNYLHILTQQYFESNLNITNTRLNNLIGPENKLFQDLTNEALTKLKKDLEENRQLSDIYDELVQSYKTYGVPEKAYIITYDKGHPELPVRVAHWKKNWELVKNNAKRV